MLLANACDISKVMKKLLVISLCTILMLVGLAFTVLSYETNRRRLADSNQIALTSAFAKHDASNAAALRSEQSKGASQAMTIKTLCELIAANKSKIVVNPILCQ